MHIKIPYRILNVNRIVKGKCLMKYRIIFKIPYRIKYKSNRKRKMLDEISYYI